MRNAEDILRDRFLIAASGASRDCRAGRAFIADYFACESDLVSGRLKKTPEDPDDRAALERIASKIARAFSDAGTRETVDKALTAWRAFGERLSAEFGREVSARAVSIFDEDYPVPLSEISAAPLVLFIAGARYSPDSRNFAVVGTRRPSKYSAAMCAKLTDGIIEAGFTVVSGMAAGIDACAHARAVEKGLATYAVLGTGIDLIYPRENRRLYGQILRHGAVVTEFLPGAGPQKSSFVLRNRIITGLSRATLVCGAGEVSGALISARYAFEQSREVFAISGDGYREDLKGCHELIRKNIAKLVINKADILEELYSDAASPGSENKAGRAAKKAGRGAVKPRADGNMEFDYGAPEGLSEDEKTVLAMVEELSVGNDAPPHVEALGDEAARRGMAAGRLLAALGALELKGSVEALEGKRYQVNVSMAGEKNDE